MKQFKKFVFCTYSQTIRTVPENYWIATIVNGEPVFDSWDKAILGRFCPLEIESLWKNKLIKIKKQESSFIQINNKIKTYVFTN